MPVSISCRLMLRAGSVGTVMLIVDGMHGRGCDARRSCRWAATQMPLHSGNRLRGSMQPV